MGVIGKLENEGYDKLVKIRGTIFKPLLSLLTTLKVKPNGISYFGVILMLSFVTLAKFNKIAALCILIAAVLIDLLDGALARYQKSDSDKGKFIDMVCDNINFTIFVIGLIFANMLGGLIGAILIYTMLLDKVVLVIYKNMWKKSDWIIHAKAGFFPNLWVALFYILFGVSVFTNVTIYNYNSFTVLGILASAMLTINMLFNFFKTIYKKG